MSNEHRQSTGCALLLIDVQNSFFHPEGGNYYPASRDVLPNLRKLLRSTRSSGRPIIFVAERHRPNLDDFELKKLPEHCVDGDFDAELFEGFSVSGDHEYFVPKRRMSAFHSTDLDLLLRELDVGQLVIAGVKANVCVRATVQDGFSLGYKCYVVRDAVNSNREPLANASLEDIERYMGWVITSAEASGMLA